MAGPLVGSGQWAGFQGSESQGAAGFPETWVFQEKKMPGAILGHVFSTGHCDCKMLFSS